MDNGASKRMVVTSLKNAEVTPVNNIRAIKIVRHSL